MKIPAGRVVILMFIREGISSGGLGIDQLFWVGFGLRTIRTADADSWPKRRRFKD